MRISKCQLTNFGSYKELEFDFSNLGLALVFGATGSGKSSLLDAAPWILFGITAKDGNVDEVRSWSAQDEPTTGILCVETSSGIIWVQRIRGSSFQNDLSWWEDDNYTEPQRGKDMKDTQRLLEERLGVTPDLYLSAAYFSEFSPTSSFFMKKAKDQREVFELIADLSTPVRLEERTYLARKETKSQLAVYQEDTVRLTTKREAVITSIARAEASSKEWDKAHKTRIQELEARAKNFEVEKASTVAALQTRFDAFTANSDATADKLIDLIASKADKAKDPAVFDKAWAELDKERQALSTKCIECGGPADRAKSVDIEKRAAKLIDDKYKNESILAQIERFKLELQRAVDEPNPFHQQIIDASNLTNYHETSLKEVKTQTNPFLKTLNDYSGEHQKLIAGLLESDAMVAATHSRLSDLNIIYDLSKEMRGVLLQQAVKSIQEATNTYMETYFDSEIRVGFELEGADSLKVSIQKSGYECVYRQLSKGQKGLLKLCFATAVMKASANKAGVHFENLFLDEALDGLDVDLKVKAFSLFESLQLDHSSILVIDHASELKQLFSKQYQVTLTDNHSEIHCE